MIKTISIKNFRCLREFDIESSSLVALIGPNGSGKSAVLHALRFFFGEMTIDDADC